MANTKLMRQELIDCKAKLDAAIRAYADEVRNGKKAKGKEMTKAEFNDGSFQAIFQAMDNFGFEPNADAIVAWIYLNRGRLDEFKKRGLEITFI
jgi:hypothetical protein